MQNITTTAELKNAIRLVKGEQSVKEQRLKEQFLLVYDSLKPFNLLKGFVKDISSSPNLIDNTLSTIIGLATGYLSKKIFIGTSGNIVRKLLGSILQLGVTNVVAKHPEGIKSIGQSVFQRIFHKKETSPYELSE